MQQLTLIPNRVVALLSQTSFIHCSSPPESVSRYFWLHGLSPCCFLTHPSLSPPPWLLPSFLFFFFSDFSLYLLLSILPLSLILWLLIGCIQLVSLLIEKQWLDFTGCELINTTNALPVPLSPPNTHTPTHTYVFAHAQLRQSVLPLKYVRLLVHSFLPLPQSHTRFYTHVHALTGMQPALSAAHVAQCTHPSSHTHA